MTSGTKILVIDDEQGIRDLFNYELSAQGYQVETAANGEEALEKIHGGRFHLVISDVRMPKLGGIETLEAIKKISPDLEVILTTGYGTIESAVDAMRRGAYDYIQKPFNWKEILAVIEKALEKRELKAFLAVYEASKAVFTAMREEALFPLVLDLVRKTLNADETSLWRVNDQGTLELAAASWGDDPARQTAMRTLIKHVSPGAGRWQEPLVFSQDARNPASRLPADLGIGAAILHPLPVKGRVLGVIFVSRVQGGDVFSAEDLRNLTIFSSQVAQAVSNARLYAELEKNFLELKRATDQLRETQKQLIQSEKLAAIGQLAAGVAHELNNPLTGILGFTQILLDAPDLPAGAREDLAAIHRESIRCGQIIKNLLRFSRRREPSKESISVSDLLDASVGVIDYEFSASRLKIVRDIQPDLPSVYGDPIQLQQVFVNILTNAKQAMAGRTGGQLMISARLANERVLIRFEDNGPGISRENITRIFDPFFTTKPAGQGTGLGLSVSYGIIEDHRGRLSVESEPGKGAVFTVELPVFRGRYG